MPTRPSELLMISSMRFTLNAEVIKSGIDSIAKDVCVLVNLVEICHVGFLIYDKNNN